MIMEQIDALNIVKYNLREIHSLMGFFSIFHRSDSSYTLEAEIYSDFGNIVSNLISEQKIEIEKISTKLGEINKELPVLKKVGDSI